MPTSTWMIVAGAGIVLAGCSVRQEGNGQAPVAESSPKPAVVTQEAPADTAETPIAVTPMTAIQTQPGPKGNSVALNKVAVTGDILTVSTTFSGGECCVHLRVDDISVIDDATSQRISVLKDNSGRYMAAPLESDGKSVAPDSFDKRSVIWFKFPAPPATSRTVSITIPGVAPFDAVPVTR